MLPPNLEKLQSSFEPFFLLYNLPQGKVYTGRHCQISSSFEAQTSSRCAGYFPYEDFSQAQFLHPREFQEFDAPSLQAFQEISPIPLKWENFESNFTRKQYVEAIQKIKGHLEAGDCYQINLSQRFYCKLPEGFDAFSYFQFLQQKHQAPYAAYLDFGDRQILSFSPELFLHKQGREILTQPIKGTRRRGNSADEDERLKQELRQSKKEKAELLMIVDLERNDLGKICETSSVRVQELYEVESQDYVHHLQAKVGGLLKEGLTLTQILQACFPGGSVTGAPKKKAMEIIRSLEPHSRGIYTGALGWVDGQGDFLLNLAIRTMEIANQEAIFCVGGGIVVDSDPSFEYEETLLKAKVFF